MRILYAIQGTGNGHLSRARDIIPILRRKGKLDILISGTQSDVGIDYPVKYRLKGLSFIFGKNGGVDILNTYLKNNTKRFLKEVNELPVQEYDLVINDFEPVSAWACHFKNKLCISLSHQAAVLSPFAPKPSHMDMLGVFILKNYAPSEISYGFHFSSFANNIYTPVIRKEVRQAEVLENDHYTVYLPAYDDNRIIDVLSKIRSVQWKVFSKHNKFPIRIDNISIQPIHNELFLKSMASGKGVLCGAGFETPAEALYLNKKLLVIPMKSQYEQHCNAEALKSMGVPQIKNLKEKRISLIEDWINSNEKIKVNYPDITESIIDMIIEKHYQSKLERVTT